MDELSRWVSAFREIWLLEIGIIGVVLYVYKGLMKANLNSEQNKKDIENHSKEIEKINGNLAALNRTTSIIETQMDQLLESTSKANDRLEHIVDHLLAPKK